MPPKVVVIIPVHECLFTPIAYYFSKYLLSAYYVPGTALGTGECNSE